MAVYTSIDDPEKHFKTVIFTGNGADDRAITVGFQPDLVFCKQRTDASGGYVVDVIRGNNAALQFSNTNQEGTFASMTFESNGITVSGNENLNNENAHNYAVWNWKAGGSGASNTSGDINSTVSANTTSGFSIVKWTGSSDASGATIAHGLSAVPKFIIAKEYDDNGNNFVVYHYNTGAGGYLQLNSTATTASSSIMWGNTVPSSSVFTVANDSQTNATGSNFIAYCFADKQGFSKFGTYEGNNSANGTFVYTGFKPAFVLIKDVDATNNWGIVDNKRANSFNEISAMLNPNVASYEGANNEVDFLSNGFKWRSTDGNSNAAETYVYAAFAEAPFVNSNGVPCNAR